MFQIIIIKILDFDTLLQWIIYKLLFLLFGGCCFIILIINFLNKLVYLLAIKT